MEGQHKARKVKVSSQMQVRIPRDLYDSYGFGSEALCVATDTGVEFRPIKDVATAHTDLLSSLLDEGLSGDELLEAFRMRAADEPSRVLYTHVTFPREDD